MVNQTYAAFWDAYRQPEMGGAILTVMHFFTHDCHKNISEINEAYKKRYNDEIECNLGKTNMDFAKTLHFQRRLIAYWYWQLAMLRYDYGIYGLSKRRLKKEFTEKERYLISLIYHMGPPAAECFEDISGICISDEQEGFMNERLYRLYEESNDWE
jgi:hypothetical protein